MPNAKSHHATTFWEETKPPLVRFTGSAIFVLVLLVLVSAPLAFGAVRPWAQGPLMIAVALAAMLWIIRLLAERETDVVFSPIGAPVLVLATYAVVRYTIAEVEPVSRPDMMLAITTLLLFFVVLNTVRHRWQITVLVWVLTAMGTALALYGLWQGMRGGRWVWWFTQYSVYTGRASGTFIRPDDFAVYLHITFAVSAANLFFSRRPFAQKIAFAFACLIMGGGLLATFSPSSWPGCLASALVLAAYLLRKRGYRFRWLIIGASVLIIVFIAAMVTTYTLRHRPDTADHSSPNTLADRQPSWHSALAIGQRNLWLGGGPGMFPWLYPTYRTVQGHAKDAGSQYLNLFAEFGVIGCLLAAWLVISFARAGYQILALRAERYSASTPSNRYAFAVGGLAAFAAVLVDAALCASLHVPAILFTLAVVMASALTCGVHHHSSGEEDVYQPGRYSALRLVRGSRFVLVGALALLVVLLGSRLRQTYPSALLMCLAEQEKARLQWAAAEKRYLQAWRFDRRNFELAVALGDFYSARATWTNHQLEKLSDQAFSWYERALTLNPRANDVLIHMARLCDALGKRELATDSYQRALQADPNNASYHEQIGLHYQRWGNAELAAKSFRRAIDLGATDSTAALELQELGKLNS